MAKMSKVQRTAILDAHDRHLKRIGHGGVSADVRTVKVLRREGFVSTTGPTFDKPTRAGLIAAGVDMDKLHAKALTEWIVRADDPRDDAVRAEAARWQARGGRGDGLLWAADITREAAHREAIEADRDRDLAVRIADERRRLTAAGFDNADKFALDNVMIELRIEAEREYREVTRAARMADSAAYQRELLRGLGKSVKGEI